MGKTKKVKEKKGRIMIDDHVLLSDISDYEYDTLVEKPQSIGTCNNFEKSSSLSVLETSQFPENHHVLYSAVPLYDKRGLSFCTSGINTGVQEVPLTTATATKPVSLSSVSTAGVKNVQFSDQVRVFDINKSNVVTEPVREERKIPPPPLINMGRSKRLSSTVKITGEGRQIPQFHVSDYVNLPAFQIEGRKIPRSHTQNLNFSDSPLIRTLPNDDVGQERRQYFWPEAVGNENFTRKRSSVMTFGGQNQFNPTPSKQGRIGDMKDISVEVDNEFFQSGSQYYTDYDIQQIDVESVGDQDDCYDPDFHDEFQFVQNTDNANEDSGFFDFTDLQYGDSDKKSSPIVEELATKVNQLCVKRPEVEKLDKILEKFAPPEN